MSYFLKHHDEHVDWFLTDRGNWSDVFADAKLFAREGDADRERENRQGEFNRTRPCQRVRVRVIANCPIDALLRTSCVDQFSIEAIGNMD